MSCTLYARYKYPCIACTDSSAYGITNLCTSKEGCAINWTDAEPYTYVFVAVARNNHYIYYNYLNIYEYN